MKSIRERGSNIGNTKKQSLSSGRQDFAVKTIFPRD